MLALNVQKMLAHGQGGVLVVTSTWQVSASGAPARLVRPDDTSGDPAILIVDDVPGNLDALEVVLEPLGRRVLRASSGNEALLRTLEADLALVLLDARMPEMDGYETARWIRSRSKTRHLPIVFVTADTEDNADLVRAYELGAVDFLCKPLNAAVVRAKARFFVELADAQRRARDTAGAEARARVEAEMLQRQLEVERDANEALTRVNAQLAADRAKSNEFLAVLGHELRNPLAPIRTCLDLIRHTPGHLGKPRFLDVMDRQLGYLNRVVDDLVDLSRANNDRLELRREPVSLEEVVEDAIAMSRPALEAKRHDLAVRSESDRVFVEGDRARLVQVVAQLVGNAVRYTPEGGHIELTYGLVGDEASVRISDDGIGIAPEALPFVFDMFMQQRSHTHEGRGLGLGLTLARRVVDLHGGTLTAKSQGPGKGSTFELRLKSCETAPRATAAVRSRRLKVRMRTVVIDDDDDIRELTAELLSAHGFEVRTAHDGPSGLQLLCDSPPDVAFVDLGLPGFDGCAIAKKFRQRFPADPTRLIAMTGFGQEEDRARAAEAGFHTHILKPVSMKTLLDVLAAREL